MADEVIYFVSDTHLGDGSGADRFRYPEQLLRLLQQIQAEPRARLVLLGDFMELWSATLEPVLIRHAPVFYLLGQLANTHPVTYVVGNHDCLPWYYFVGQGTGNIQVVEQFTAARGALVALHGHQFDPFNKIKVAEGHIKAPWTRRLVSILGFLGRIGGDSAGDAIADAATVLEQAANSLESLLPTWDELTRKNLQGLLRQAKNVVDRESPGERGYPAGEQAYEEAARSFMRRGARFVVMGHTHHPLRHQYGGRVYVNTGSWVWDRYPPTFARFAQGRLDLLDANTLQPYAAETSS